MISRITASESSMDTVWFVIVTSEEETSNMEVKNHYGNILEPFFEKETRKKKYVKINSQGNLHIQIYYCITICILRSPTQKR